MKILQILTLNALLLSTATHAWTFYWTDSDGDRHVVTEEKSKGCTKIAQPQDALYKWDPEGSYYCVHMFKDSECEERGGWSCISWGPRRQGGNWTAAFAVNTFDGWGNDNSLPSTAVHPPEQTGTGTGTKSDSESTITEISSASSETATETSTSPSDTTPTEAATSVPGTSSQTQTPSETPVPSTGGPSLSGGAIAGVVVGTCAGVGIMGLFGLLAYRRRRQSNSDHGAFPDDVAAASSEPPPAPPPPPKNNYSELEATGASPVSPGLSRYADKSPPFAAAAAATMPAAQVHTQQPQMEKGGGPAGYPYMTTQGQHVAELPDTARRPEMEGSSGRLDMKAW